MKLLIVVVVIIVAFVVGRRSVRPMITKFGLGEAESVRDQLGGLSPEQAKVVRIAAAVGKMDFVLVTEINNERDRVVGVIKTSSDAIAGYEQLITAERTKIKEASVRSHEVSAIATAFEL